MSKVCLAFQLFLLSGWILLVAQTYVTSAFGHQGGGVDHSAGRRQKEDEEFSATKLEKASHEIVRHRDEETRAFLLSPNLNFLPKNLEASTQITTSLNNNLSRNKRSQNDCVLNEGELINPGTTITFKDISTTLHVQANKPFRLDIEVSSTLVYGGKMTVSSESLGVSRDVEWNSIAIELSLHWYTLLYYWKCEFKYGDKVLTKWRLIFPGVEFHSMTITVTNCIKWYSGVMRPACHSPATVTTSPRPTTPRGTDNPGSVSEYSVDPLFWLLVLPLGVMAAVVCALGWRLKRKHYERKAVIALAMEAAIQPRVRHESINSLYGVVHRPVQRHESINSLYESSDLKLNPVCGTGTWSPSSRECSGPTQEENIYEN